MLLFAPLVMWWWRRQAQRAAEPSDLSEISLGCAFFAGACFVLGAEQWLADNPVPVLARDFSFSFARLRTST